MRNIDGDVTESEDLDGNPNIVHGSDESMDRSSEKTGKSSEVGLVDSAMRNRVTESKREVSMDEGVVREAEQEINENGCQTEADGHGRSECLGDEKFAEPSEESEALICNNEVVGKINGTEDSDQILYHEEVAMERSGLKDAEKMLAKSKDAEKLTEDAGGNENLINHDDVVAGGNGVRDSRGKNAVNKYTGKSAEDLEESEGRNPNLAMPVEDIREMEAEVTLKEKEEENTVAMVEAEGDEMRHEMADGKEEINDEGGKKMKEGEECVEMLGDDRSVELAEEKEMDTGRKEEEEKEKVQTAEESEVAVERAKGKRERDAEIPEEEERRADEKQDVEMNVNEKERDVETEEREDMGIGTLEETEMGDKKTEEKRKESEIGKEEFGGARGDEVEEEIEKSQRYELNIKERSKGKKNKKRGGKGEEFVNEVHVSMSKEPPQRVARESTIALRKGGMEGESKKQDKSGGRNITKEIQQDGAEEHLPCRNKDETCKKQKNGVSRLAHSDPLKESQNQTCQGDLEPHQKETNKDLTVPTPYKELQILAMKKQTTGINTNNSDVVNTDEDSLGCTGKNQCEADEEVGERGGESDVPNLGEPSPKQAELKKMEIEEKEESNSERKINQQEVEKSKSGLRIAERETLIEQEVENRSSRQTTEERETLSEQEGEESNSGQIIEEREALNHQVVERGNSGQNIKKRKVFNLQGKVNWGTPSSQVIKESDPLSTDSTLMEVIPKAAKQFHSGDKVTLKPGQCGEQNNPSEMKHKGISSVTSSDVGSGVYNTSKIMSGKNSIARKSTSKMNCKIPKTSRDQSIDASKEKGKPENGRERGEASPAEHHTQVSSLVQHPSAKETTKRKMPSKVYIYTRRPEGNLTTLPWSVVASQQWNHSGKRQGSNDPDIEIISENISTPSDIILPRTVAPIVCDVCHMTWNNNVLEAIFEGNKAVTVNSRITYGAILCLNRYANVHYWENKDQTLRNVLERADLGKNIGNLKMTDVIKWLNHMIRDGLVKCCDVFDAVYSAENASVLLTSLLKPESDVASQPAPRQQNKGKPVEEAPKRKKGDSNRVNSQGKASAAAAKPSSHQDASLKIPVVKDIKKIAKSTHSQVCLPSLKVPVLKKVVKSTNSLGKVKESPSSTGEVLKGKATLKKSDAHAPKTALKNISEVANKTVTHEKVILKECSVNLGIRVQVPQQRTRLWSESSRSPSVSKRWQSLEVDNEVSCEKKGRISGPPLSDKESSDTEDSLHLENKNSAKTTSKKSRTAVSKQCLEEDKFVRREKNEMLESETSEDAENTNDLPVDKDTTNVPDKLDNEMSNAESEPEQKMDESEETRRGKDSTRAKDKILYQDDIGCKRPVKRNRKPSNLKEKSDKTDVLHVEHKPNRVKHDETPDILVSNKLSINKKKTYEIDMLQVENKTKGVQQDVSTDVLVSNSLLKQKKRCSGDPAAQPLKKQRVLSGSQRDSPNEDVSKHPSEVNGRLSPTTGTKTRGKAKSNASSDSKSLSLSLENTKDNLTDTVARRTRRKSKSCASTDSRDSEDLSPSLENANDDLTDTVVRRTRRKSKSCASTDSRDSKSLSLSTENTNDSLLDTVKGRTRRKTKSCASTDSRDIENLSPSLEDTNDSLSDDLPPSCDFSDESDHEVNGKRSLSPLIRATSKKTLNSPKVLKTKSQRILAVKGVVPCRESSSDNCDQQITGTVDLTPHLSRSIAGELEPCSENTEESTNVLVQQLGLNSSGINLYCNVTDTKILTNGDMTKNASGRGQSIPAIETMLKERSNLDGVARDAYDLLPFESSNFSISGNGASKERFLTNQELLVLQNICVLNPENPDVDMFYQILIQILLARKRILLVPNSLTLLLLAEGIRREFNRAKRKGKYVLYLAQDWDADKLYTAEDFWLGNKRPPNIPSVSTVLSMFCLWKNLEKRFPISFPIALEELCRNLALWDVDKIGICVKLYSTYCTFLYEEKNLNLTQFFLNQPFLGTQTELQKKSLLCRMTGNSKQIDEKSYNEKSSIHSFNVSENDVQILMKQCMEAEQAALQSSNPKDEEVFRKSVQALKYKVDAYKKEINQIQKVIKETEKKKSQLLIKLNNPQFKDCVKELNKTIENLYRTLSRRTAKYEVIREVENMSVKEVSRASRPPAVVVKGADLGEDVSESMKELVYELLMNEVKIEEVRPALCAIVQNLSDKDMSVVPTNTWIRNFARVAGLKVITRSNVLRW